MLCNIIHSVLHNMLRAKNALSFSPSWVWIGQPAVPVYLTITCRIGPHHRRGPCHVSGGAHRRPRWGGRECAEEERWPQQQRRPRCSWPGVDTWCSRPASCAQRTSCRALQALSSTSSSFSMAPASLYKKSSLALINNGILSLHEGRHSKEARQIGHHHLGHAWPSGTSGKLGQSNAPVARPRSSDASCGAQVLQVRALTLRDAFHGRHWHGLHALPITVLGEHVGLEVGDEGRASTWSSSFHI
jgi:hypothetical protein